MQKNRAEQRIQSLATPSFLGLLGDHAAGGSHRTAAVGLLLLSWFQNLYQVENI